MIQVFYYVGTDLINNILYRMLGWDSCIIGFHKNSFYLYLVECSLIDAYVTIYDIGLRIKIE